MTAPPTIAILMATYNGEQFIAEQLQSICDQTHVTWHLYISDDGSTDATHDIIARYQAQHPGHITVFDGPRKGFARNFLSLICNPSVQADYYAYADQDDVWQNDKLIRAVRELKDYSHMPALYGARTALIDADGHALGFSKQFKKPLSFANALVQNIATGNTMVLNQAACNLLRQAGPSVPISTHDWWSYILVTAYNGHVVYDTTPSMLYRQHAANIVGANVGFRSKLKRLARNLTGRLSDWHAAHEASMAAMSFLPQANQTVQKHFHKARTAILPLRFYYLIRSGVYRQTFLGNVELALATLLKTL